MLNKLSTSYCSRSSMPANPSPFDLLAIDEHAEIPPFQPKGCIRSGFTECCVLNIINLQHLPDIKLLFGMRQSV